jgi:hypothetical protein
VRFGCWISPFYGSISLGMRFETYEPFTSLTVFFGRGSRALLYMMIISIIINIVAAI